MAPGMSRPERSRYNRGATRWLSVIEAELARGAWVDLEPGQVTFADYSRQWLALRTDLRPRTRELYASLLKLHVVPALGSFEIGRITPSVVRVWYSELSSDEGPGRATAARCYRLLRTIMNAAVTDELTIKNPCQVKGAGAERSPERPIATVPQVHALAEAIEPRFRAAILLASCCSLRRGGQRDDLGHAGRGRARQAHRKASRETELVAQEVHRRPWWSQTECT